MSTNLLTNIQANDLITKLEMRFAKNTHRHKGVNWLTVLEKLQANPEKLTVLYKMEETGGEPDVIEYDAEKNQLIFFDCSEETPKGRRSICYDQLALDERKENKPYHSALGLASEMGVTILSEIQYRKLQTFGIFDAKTSSWIQTPDAIRKLGGALFADFRYGQVFIYHNGAQSYYAARAFRGCLTIS